MKGFTLLQKILVVLVIGILVVLVLPKFSKKETNNNYVLSVKKHISNVEEKIKNKSLNGTYSFNDLGISSTDVRCSAYKITKKKVVEADNCEVENENYCYSNNEVVPCINDNVNNDPILDIKDEPKEEPKKEETPKVINFSVLDFSEALLEEGEINSNTGDNSNNNGALRTTSFYSIKNDSYNVEMTKTYRLTIFEYDKDFNYLKSYKTLSSNGVYTPSNNAAYIKLTIKSNTTENLLEKIKNKQLIVRISINEKKTTDNKDKKTDDKKDKDPIEDPIDDPIEDPIDDPIDDPIEDPIDEPTPIPEFPKGPDLYLLDLSVISLTNGDLDNTTGEGIENGRRMRTSKFYSIKYEKYNVDITKDFGLTVYEYDENQNYLGNHITFTDTSYYTPSENAKYFKLTLRAPSSKEKSYSNGQWYKVLAQGNPIARLYVGDVASLKERNKYIFMEVENTISAEEIQDDLLNNKERIADDVWHAIVSNGLYDPSIDANKKTYYISGNGDDNNSGLTKDYPKRTADQFSSVRNLNLLFEAGYTYEFSKGFKVTDGVTIASYGKGSRPVLSFYRDLNHTFTPVEGYDDLYVTDIHDLPDYNGAQDKSDCNLGQLVIDGEVNWKRAVVDTDSEFTPSLLLNNKDEKSWSIDHKNAKLYMYTTGNPNTYNIRYAPAVTGLAVDSASNVTIKGIEITGAGLHAINATNANGLTIHANSFKYIGGSILTKAGVRYGNAVQLWNNAKNVTVTNNIARWIFDTCYTNQGSYTEPLTKVLFKNNIAMYSQWGLETTGAGEGYDVEYSENLVYHMTDITEPYVKMQVSGSGHLYGEKTDATYISYRNGYKYHQASTLAIWNFSSGYFPNISNNIFWETNRFLFIGTGSTTPVDISSLNDNLFYEDYHLSNDGGAALFKVKAGGNKYYTSLSSITSSETNTVSIHKKSSNYDNTVEKARMLALINKIIGKTN